MKDIHRALWLCIGAAVTHTAAAQDHVKDKDNNEEETYIFGSRSGNFTVITEDAQKLVDMPGALGDPLSAVFSLPGVIASDGDGGEPAVRGSSPNDNLYLVDFLPAGYVFHDFSNSIFSEFIIQDFQLYSAGFGPEHGNATGAVFDISLRQPKQQKLHTTIDLSLLRSGIFTEGQVSENSAFYLSARKSLIHLVVPEDEEEDGVRIVQVPQDEDYQFKYAWQPSDKHTLTLSANGANDLAEAEFTRESDIVRSNPDFEGDAKLTTDYNGQNIVYDFVHDNGTQFKVGLGKLNTGTKVRWGDSYFNNYKEDADIGKFQLTYPITTGHTLTVGGQVNDTTYTVEYDQVLFTCTEFEPDCSLNRRERVADNVAIDIQDHSLFINDTWAMTDKLTADMGVQWQENDYTDESFVHPRLALHYKLSDTLSLSSKWGQYNQLPELETIFPEFGNPKLLSPTSEHTTIGLLHELGDGWSWNLEMYYKTFDDLPLALKPTAADGDLLYANEVQGKAYGFDLLVNKEDMGNWYGWLALSYGKSERTNERTQQTKNYFLDTPLVINWVMKYEFSERFDFGWRWQIKSGSAYTPITGVQENPYFEDAVLPEYGDPFSEHLPTYSRLDMRFKWNFTLGGNDASVIVDMINVLNQQNVTERTLDYEKVRSVDDPVVTEDAISIGFIPAVGFRYSF